MRIADAPRGRVGALCERTGAPLQRTRTSEGKRSFGDSRAPGGRRRWVRLSEGEGEGAVLSQKNITRAGVTFTGRSCEV